MPALCPMGELLQFSQVVIWQMIPYSPLCLRAFWRSGGLLGGSVCRRPKEQVLSRGAMGDPLLWPQTFLEGLWRRSGFSGGRGGAWGILCRLLLGLLLHRDGVKAATDVMFQKLFKELYTYERIQSIGTNLDYLSLPTQTLEVWILLQIYCHYFARWAHLSSSTILCGKL